MTGTANATLLREGDDIRKLLRSQNGTVSNCYWTLSEAQKSVQMARIYELQAMDGIAWILREPGRSQFYFRVRPERVGSFSCELPEETEYVAEWIYKEEQRSQSPPRDAERTILRRCGFELADRARMLTRSATEMQIEMQDGIRRGQETEVEEIQRLLCESFDALTDAIPMGTDLTSCLREGKIWIREEKEPQAISGCLMLETEGRRTWIRHLAVDSKKRRKGIAKSLLTFTLSCGFLPEAPDNNGGHVFSLWVKESNGPALRLYEEMGFKPSNREMEIWTRTAIPGRKQK